MVERSSPGHYPTRSRRTTFRRGTGLPGMAWDSGLPVFMDDLGHGSRFLRADSALQVGINRGFALPCSSLGAGQYVMTFLSALATPLVRRFEIWLPDASRTRLQRSYGFSEGEGMEEGGAERLQMPGGKFVTAQYEPRPFIEPSRPAVEDKFAEFIESIQL